MDITIGITTEDDRFIPTRQSGYSAGYDLKAALADTVILQPGERKLISAGIKIEIPAGWEGQVRPRSGLALKHGITLLNAPGTIDSDYRGDIGIILYNAGDQPFHIGPGDRIAQIIFAPVSNANFRKTVRLQESGRGEGGFGSTGK